MNAKPKIKNPKPQKSPRKARSQSDLARILGVTRQVVAARIKAGGAPPLGDTEAWIALLASDGRADGAAPPEWRAKLAEARHKLIAAQAAREELKLAAEQNRVVDRHQVESDIRAGISELYSNLDRVFCCELPPALIGLAEMDIRARCKTEIEELKRALRERFYALARAAQENDGPVPDQSHDSAVAPMATETTAHP